MMLTVQLFLLALLGDGVYMAPVIDTVATAGDVDSKQHDLDEMLEEALLSNAQNVDKITKAFYTKQEYLKVCAPFNYIINCTRREECANTTTATFTCADGYSSTFVWTSFDPYSFTGTFLLFTAQFNWTVFGFEWGGACDLRESNTPVLNIIVSSRALKILCGVDGKMYLDESLRSLTQRVSYFMLGLCMLTQVVFVYWRRTLLAKFCVIKKQRKYNTCENKSVKYILTMLGTCLALLHPIA